MSKETPKDDPRERSDSGSMKQTDKPWKGVPEKDQFDPDRKKPDIDKWNEQRPTDKEDIMGLATYAVIATGANWGVLHDGNVEGEFETKESAFEAAVAAASVAIRQGHEVHVSAPSPTDEHKTALGGPTN